MLISILFPILAVIVSIFAYVVPDVFAPHRGLIVPLLMIIMFAMGLTLKASDFTRVIAAPRAVGVGVLLQYTVMPLAALAIGTILSLPDELIVGLVLLGCSPGGTASNVMTYLARANVALSVSMTLVSSLLAVFLTPALVWLLVGKTVPVAVGSMLGSLVQIVLVPIALGTAINAFWGERLGPVRPALPVVATAAILMAIAIVVALNRDNLARAGFDVLVAAVAHNLIGLTAGYWIARAFGLDRLSSRTVSIEVGMQNSGLSVALALQYFSALSALPGAIASVWQNLTGSALAGYWSRHPPAGAGEAAPTRLTDQAG